MYADLSREKINKVKELLQKLGAPPQEVISGPGGFLAYYRPGDRSVDKIYKGYKDESFQINMPELYAGRITVFITEVK